jgi:hypothetical protein
MLFCFCTAGCCTHTHTHTPVQYSTVQHSTAQYNTVQHKINNRKSPLKSCPRDWWFLLECFVVFLRTFRPITYITSARSLTFSLTSCLFLCAIAKDSRCIFCMFITSVFSATRCGSSNHHRALIYKNFKNT